MKRYSISIFCFLASFWWNTAAIANSDSNSDEVTKYLRTMKIDVQPDDFKLAIVRNKSSSARTELIYLHTKGWCGTSGCELIILSYGHGKRSEAGEFTVQLPIALLDSSRYGKPVFVVRHFGGGVLKMKCGLLRFDGTKYVDIDASMHLCRGSKKVLIDGSH